MSSAHNHHGPEEDVYEIERELDIKAYFRNIYTALFSAMKGIFITTRYIWAHKPVPIEYPEVREKLPERSRSRLFNDVDDCISCTQCAMACPVDCIYIASKPRSKEAEPLKTSNGTPIRLDLTQFTIDTTLCCYCGLCTTVCPTECLTHTTDFEYSQYTLSNMKYDYLASDVRAWKKRLKG